MSQHTDPELSCIDTDTESSVNSSGESRLKKLRRWMRSRFNEDVGEEIQTLIEERDNADKQHLSDDERELIASILKFNTVDADDACVPRSDVVYVSKDDDFSTIVKHFVDSGFSRLPVCGKDLDEVLGFVTLKDVVPYLMDTSKEFSLRKAMQTCTFVPETLAASAVLAEFRKNKTALAIVVDEYGGTTGLITLTDILEELVGDIDYEEDGGDDEIVQQLSLRRFRIDPRGEISDLDDDIIAHLGAVLCDEYDTVGGFVLSLAGCVPAKGTSLDLASGHKLIVSDADGRRIKGLTLRLVDAKT